MTSGQVSGMQALHDSDNKLEVVKQGHTFTLLSAQYIQDTLDTCHSWDCNTIDGKPRHLRMAILGSNLAPA